MLPCHKENENNKYYNGNTSILHNNKRCRNCEFVKSLCYFMFKEFNDYALEKCCDVDYPNNNQPEAILVNKNNPLDKIVIEVKSIHELFNKNIKKDENERNKIHHFHGVIDKIGKKTFEILNSKLDKLNIPVIPEFENLFLDGLLLQIYVDSEYKEINGYKYRESRPIHKEFLTYKHQKENKLINDIAENVVNYIMCNIKSCIKSLKFIPYREF